MSIVFVIDKDGTPLLPCHPARSRKLLREGKATVKQVVPFTIQLTKKVNKPVGEFELGIDDGAKHVGLAVKNTKTNLIVFRGQLDHRQDVKLLMERRRNFRKTRRYKLRHRKPRYKNRIRPKVVPSIHQRKDAVLRVLKDLSKRLNIVKVKVEEIKFNHFEHKYGKYFSLVEIGKTYLREQIQKLGYKYESTFGYVTKPMRLSLGLNKNHSNDACAIVESNKYVVPEYFIKPRRTKSRKDKKYNEKNGFRHYDLVKINHKTKGIIIGSICSLKAKQISLRTKFQYNFPVSYSKTKLLQRFNGLIYSW